MIELLMTLLNVAVYAGIGIVLMILGIFLIDLAVPCHFPTEIKKGNEAVGWLTAGAFIGIGLILRAAVISPPVEALEETLLQGIVNSAVYFIIGIIFFILSYIILNLFNRKYKLNEEIGKGNKAAGTMVFGIFIGLACLISGVIG